MTNSQSTTNLVAGTVGALAVGAAVGAYVYFKTDKKEVSKPAPASLEVIPTPAPITSAGIGPGDAVIYFGSQTGTAEAFSKEIQEYLANNGASAEVIDLEDWAPETFVNRKIVILVVATYGEGDPTDSAVAFNKWVTSKKTDADLSHMKFTVLGLGNRQYVNYNEMARRCETHMLRLGATSFCTRGECDDDQDVEADFSGWLNTAFSSSYKSVFFPGNSPSSKAANQPAVSDVPEDSDLAIETSKKAPLQAFLALTAKEATSKAPALSQKFTSEAVMREMKKSGKTANPGNDLHARMYFTGLTGKVTGVKELRQVVDFSKGDSTVKVDVKLPASHPSDGEVDGAVTYRTAHNLDILPANSASLVDAWMTFLNVKDERDLFVFFGPKLGQVDPNKRPFPAPVKVKDALTWFCDLQMVPTKGTLKELAGYLTSKAERAALLELLQEKNKDLFTEIVKKCQISFLEFAKLCLSSLHIPLGDFLQLCPRQRPRPYTISSSSLAQPDTVSITVSRVVDSSIPSDLSEQIATLKAQGFAPLADAEAFLAAHPAPRVSSGVTTTWLCEAAQAGGSINGQEVRIAIKPSLFNLPANKAAPVIMVGAGTGLAPFIGLVDEFAHLAKDEATKWTGERVLVFGCQNSQRDFIYKKELHSACDTGALSRLITAFSREQTEKFYVQDAIRKEAAYLRGLLEKEGATVMICGATKMGHSVAEAIASIFGEGGEEKVAAMKKEGRFLEELWA